MESGVQKFKQGTTGSNFLCPVMSGASTNEIWRLKVTLLLWAGIIWSLLHSHPCSWWRLLSKTSPGLLAVIPSHGLSMCLCAGEFGLPHSMVDEFQEGISQERTSWSVCSFYNLSWESHNVTSIRFRQVEGVNKDVSRFMDCQRDVRNHVGWEYFGYFWKLKSAVEANHLTENYGKISKAK